LLAPNPSLRGDHRAIASFSVGLTSMLGSRWRRNRSRCSPTIRATTKMTAPSREPAQPLERFGEARLIAARSVNAH
jgi:hypothetical protein